MVSISSYRYDIAQRKYTTHIIIPHFNYIFTFLLQLRVVLTAVHVIICFGKYLTRGFSSEVLVLNRGPCTESRPNGRDSVHDRDLVRPRMKIAESVVRLYTPDEK